VKQFLLVGFQFFSTFTEEFTDCLYMCNIFFSF
jgi:hypothetical protein